MDEVDEETCLNDANGSYKTFKNVDDASENGQECKSYLQYLFKRYLS